MFSQTELGKQKRKKIWTEAAATATKLDVILSDGVELSPYEKFYGKLPDYSNYLRTFGEMGVLTQSNTNKMKDKISDRGFKAVCWVCKKPHWRYLHNVEALNQPCLYFKECEVVVQ